MSSGESSLIATASGERYWRGLPMRGEGYTEVLSRLHHFLAPRNYLEIGVNTGATLALANCPSIAIDPAFALDRPFLGQKKFCNLYQMTSDAFFADFSPTQIFGRPIDLAFLDGMHLFEFLLRDFMNTERHARHNSVICLHDCIPVDNYVARRDTDDQSLAGLTGNRGWWAGDVWKVVAILQKYRPDLHIHAINAEPTGLIAITGLEPASTTLAEGYFDILRDYRDLTLEQAGDAYIAGLNIRDTAATMTQAGLGHLFWL